MNSSQHPIEIIYDHADFLIVNKPINVPMHHAELGIITLLERQLQYAKLFLVHRLDTPTSGCLVVAKNKASASLLSQLFQERSVTKFYLALLDNKPRKKQGTIRGDMINRRGGQMALLRTTENPAITQFHTFSIAPKLRVALVKPITGKTHQIRVALKSIGSAIIGDIRYKGSNADRLYLHAWGIQFSYNNELIRCHALPKSGHLFVGDEFNTWLNSAPIPEQLKWP